ncbi:MAG: hypothetical protein FD149_1652 [Rhodospirillaceae bacterium]|nr:MAG: hypothetical protein FD149_1652 [Rhodospirillaceae bacterium]
MKHKKAFFIEVLAFPSSQPARIALYKRPRGWRASPWGYVPVMLHGHVREKGVNRQRR